jgi:hypothetical protein
VADPAPAAPVVLAAPVEAAASPKDASAKPRAPATRRAPKKPAAAAVNDQGPKETADD